MENITLPKTLTDHPSLVGIIRMPWANHVLHDSSTFIPVIQLDDSTGKWKQYLQRVELAKSIRGVVRVSTLYNIPKNNITDFYPYTYYVLTDGETDPLILKPEYMPSSVYIEGKIALSNQPIERYFIPGYKGDNTGNIYNITNLSQMMLPTATNEGIGFINANANTMAQTRKNMTNDNIMNAVNGVGSTIGATMVGGVGVGAMTGANAIKNNISGLSQIKQLDARNNDQMLTPTSISSFGTPSSRNQFDTDKVQLLKYTIKDNMKNKINNYVNRYGNTYNNYSKIDITNYKGYIKMISPNIDSKIDNNHIDKIKQILERGVFCE